MKLYVSGPMTGLPEFNYPAFDQAASELRRAGHEVCSPHEVEVQETWEDYLRIDLRLLLGCEAVATLPGWESSRGASLECHVARCLGMTIAPVEAFLAEAA